MREGNVAQIAKKREKGKIARGQWPEIIGRYSNGETIASIGRGYGCTAPAIRYIIKRSGLLKGGQSAVSKTTSRQRTSGSGGMYDTGTATTLSRATDATPVAPSRERMLGGNVFGADLRKRVFGDLATFLVALDHVVADRSIESLTRLQDATDCLMRSIARTRMEVERLLSSKDAAATD